MAEAERNEEQQRYAFSSNLRLKLSNFMTAGQVRTSMAVDAQRLPLWGETWVEHTWWEVQPHFAVLQPREEAPPPSAVVEIEQAAPPRVEKGPKK